jgi:hypothetical protein
LLNPEPFANSVYESVSNTEHLVRTSLFHTLGLDASGSAIRSSSSGSSSSQGHGRSAGAGVASPVAAAGAAAAGKPDGSSRPATAATAGGPFADMYAAHDPGEFDDGDDDAPPAARQISEIGCLD